MDELTNFSQLLPPMQEAVKYIATAAVGGVIGNRADGWFNALFFHQRRNIIKWLKKWNPTKEDLESIMLNEKCRHFVSKIVQDVSNELYDNKLKTWAKITDSVIRNSKIPFDKKAFFMKCFASFEEVTVQFLAKLYQEPMPHSTVFPTGSTALKSDEDEVRLFAYVQSTTSNLTTNSAVQGCFSLTHLGREFIEFISDSAIGDHEESK